MNQPVLITGASGFVGQALTAHMLELGYHLICPTRQPLTTQHDDMRNPLITGLDAQTDWTEYLQQAGAVIHCAARVHVMHETATDPLSLFRALNVDASVNLARQAAAAGVKHFIYLSSVKVNGERSLPGHPLSEEDIAATHDPYGLSKYEAERALLTIGKKTSMAITIVRPPLIYGPGVKANFLSMMQAVRRGIPLPLASINNQRSLVYIGNLTHFLTHCLYHPQAKNEVFQVSDNQDLSTPALLKACAQALQVKPRLFAFPPGWLSVLARISGRPGIADRLCESLQVDISKARRQLGWEPPFTVAQGLQYTAEHESSRN
ncbi:SDR family oxidoreductase [Undibacterium sp. CY7W]|uniref:SDR family oxidoreductase n=1 Tax=Undibacterium rugosum TaxID=2762291 RepID=A0A923L001_9BURK|nr:SDR family oxidoreductase [Undibacterium rugosum]MBC3935991.1 SDR family oxidoreductase [Undibacterium rugosum]